MRLILLFFGWMILCGSSLSTQGQSSNRKFNTFSSHKRFELGQYKSVDLRKIVLGKNGLRYQKADALFNSFFSNTKKFTLKACEYAMSLRHLINASYRYTFSYIYPKHAFW